VCSRRLVGQAAGTQPLRDGVPLLGISPVPARPEGAARRAGQPRCAPCLRSNLL